LPGLNVTGQQVLWPSSNLFAECELYASLAPLKGRR
jgi:hypothetical protein